LAATFLNRVLHWNQIALLNFQEQSLYEFSVDYWLYDAAHLVFDIGVSTGVCRTRLLLVYRAKETQPLLEVLELPGSWTLLNQTPPEDILTDWILFGWRQTRSELSTVVRAILWAGKALEALQAESALAAGDGSARNRAPQGLLAVHNTPEGNWQSICRHGLSLKFSPTGIWLRPPSFGRISSSLFRGNLSFLVDLGGLTLSQCNGDAIVVQRNIPLSRVQRLFDLESGRDA
jgi:hypothetical protein